MITWLHISDIHFNSLDDDTPLLRERLLDFLRNYPGHIDYIFCTGDLRTAPGDFLDESADYLKTLCKTIDTPVDRLFIVPGNHDVNRESRGRDEAIKALCFHRMGSYDPETGEVDDKTLETIREGQKEFRAFLAKIYDASRLEKYQVASRPHFNIETEDCNVLHVDTTLIYTREQEANDLIVGIKPLQKALDEINENKPVVLITHYPFTSLLQGEKKIISELLYQKGISLWLAGHEHDQILQKVGYLDCIQSGKLCDGDKMAPTILIGEHKENGGFIEGYYWSSGEWRQYQSICHDSPQEKKYPVRTKIPRDCGLSREKVKANQADFDYLKRFSEYFIPSLLPELEFEDGGKASCLNDALAESWNTSSPHVILQADGGMGKTTVLLDACATNNIPAVYIPLEKLNAIKIGVRDYCLKTVFDNDLDHFADFTRSKGPVPSLLLLIDGLNEVDGQAGQDFINEIQCMTLSKGIQVVITSRTEIAAYFNLSGYRVGSLKPLVVETIRKQFTDDEWNDIKDSAALYKLLSNPMMVTIYKEICPVITRYRKIGFLDWALPIENVSNLLHDYFVAQIAVLLLRTGRNGPHVISAAQIVFELLPAIAYEFESRNKLNATNEMFRQFVSDAIRGHQTDGNRLASIQTFLRCPGVPVPELKSLPVIDFLVAETHLLYDDGELTSFPHQIFRDYLSARWIVRETEKKTEEIWNTRHLPFSVMEYIRDLTREYWNSTAKLLHDAGRGKDNVRILIENLLDCFPAVDGKGIPDYSGLDLRGVHIPDASYHGPISMRDTRIDRTSIGRNWFRAQKFTCLKFSDDNRFLACASEGSISIYSLDKEMPPFVFSRIRTVLSMYFAGEYLFSVSGIPSKELIGVFAMKEDQWQYLGDIPTFNFGAVFKNHLVILKEDLLHYYCKNRELCFRLSDCTLIYNEAKKNAQKNAVDGIRLVFQICGNNEEDLDRGIAGQTTHDDLMATSFLDGRLVVTSGETIQYILNRGVTLLKDGAISGNGRMAATLSYDIFGGQRKIQIWDLAINKKSREIFCPETISKIHMSDSGQWLIGETLDDTWIYHIDSAESHRIRNKLISNQKGRITTYDDRILLEDGDHVVSLYSLATREKKTISDRYGGVCFACFMPDDSLAVVTSDRRELVFRNTQQNILSKEFFHNARILGIQGMKNKPYLAVSTDDGILSLYHTGDAKRKRKFETLSSDFLMVVHPESNVIANSCGKNRFQTHNLYEKLLLGKQVGWWYDNNYGKDNDDPPVFGDVLDLAFNLEKRELVVILSSGQIIFCHEKYCRYHDCIEIITSFNVDGYDFDGCICTDEIKKQLNCNKSQGNA